MPEKATIERAQRAKRQGKSPSTQAGEFVREEMHHIREGKHGAKSAKQAIAIGLSKARRSGVKLKAKGPSADRPQRKPASSPKRAAAAKRALKRQPRSAASHRALSRQAHSAARSRTRAARSASARKAARTRARTSASR
jgi:hypothetical protein